MIPDKENLRYLILPCLYEKLQRFYAWQWASLSWVTMSVSSNLKIFIKTVIKLKLLWKILFERSVSDGNRTFIIFTKEIVNRFSVCSLTNQPQRPYSITDKSNYTYIDWYPRFHSALIFTKIQLIYQTTRKFPSKN